MSTFWIFTVSTAKHLKNVWEYDQLLIYQIIKIWMLEGRLCRDSSERVILQGSFLQQNEFKDQTNGFNSLPLKNLLLIRLILVNFLVVWSRSTTLWIVLDDV